MLPPGHVLHGVVFWALMLSWPHFSRAVSGLSDRLSLCHVNVVDLEGLSQLCRLATDFARQKRRGMVVGGPSGIGQASHSDGDTTYRIRRPDRLDADRPQVMTAAGSSKDREKEAYGSQGGGVGGRCDE